jgi:hypothetical protein
MFFGSSRNKIRQNIEKYDLFSKYSLQIRNVNICLWSLADVNFQPHNNSTNFLKKLCTKNEVPKSGVAGTQTYFLFPVSVWGPKGPPKRQAPKFKIEAPKERGPKRFFSLFQHGIQPMRGPKESLYFKAWNTKEYFLIILNSVSKMPLGGWGGGQGAPRWYYATGPPEC